jgi:1-deoxyxylulose-5-phosphate synthase
LKYARIPHLDKDIAKIVCGTDWLMGVAPGESFKTLDAYVAAGGNCFDTAHCYGANSNILGAWLKTRHQAHKFVFLNKGNHPYGSPCLNEASTMSDIQENHYRLGLDHTDLYVFHRDDESVPVETVVDFMNRIISRGFITAYGGSNWTVERVAAANAYAEQSGKQGFSCNNPNLTLAHCGADVLPSTKLDEIGTSKPNSLCSLGHQRQEVILPSSTIQKSWRPTTVNSAKLEGQEPRN